MSSQVSSITPWGALCNPGVQIVISQPFAEYTFLAAVLGIFAGFNILFIFWLENLHKSQETTNQ
jgi:hypothetical protein